MFLAVNAGNTHVKFGLMHGQQVLGESRLTTQRMATSDELQVFLRFLPGIENVPRADWEGAAISSVVPSLDHALQIAVERAIGMKPLLLDPLMNLGLKNLYRNPAEVGMDRLANAVAGHAAFGTSLAICDFGTATTIDIVSNEGNYLGGIILAGLETTADALFKRTSKLPQISITKPSRVLGATTSEAMLSGLYFGAIDAVQGIVARTERELGYNLKLILTGGLAKTIASDMQRVEGVDEHLTLKGIQQIWALNR